MLESYKECLRYIFTGEYGRPVFPVKKNNPGRTDRIISAAIGVIWQLVKIYAYVLLFVALPAGLFAKYAASGSAGFGKVNTYIYFILILTCFSGSVIHSCLFDTDESAYVALRVMRIRPRIYFRVRLLLRAVIELTGYWSVLAALGIGAGKSFFLAVVVIFSRMFGECFNILVFRVTGKNFRNIKGADVSVMLVALFAAYFIPYVRGYVPAAYDILFSPVTIIALTVVGAAMAYYVWNCEHYNRITAKLVVKKIFYDNTNTGERKETEPVYSEQTSACGHCGYRYMINLFFERNRKMFVKMNTIKLVFVAVLFMAGVISVLTGHGDVTGRVISYSVYILVFVMYCMCDTWEICRVMFGQHDRYMLRCETGNAERLDDFLYRAVKILKVNALPVLSLAAAYALVGIMVLEPGDAYLIVRVCAGILILAVLYTFLGLGMYYLLQPYNSSGKQTGCAYMILNFFIYIGGYGCIYIKISGTLYILVTAAVSAVLIMAVVTMVYRLGEKTFRIKK